MNDYFKMFQNIDQSVEQILTDEHHSLEIKQSTTNLGKSVQPCFKELKQSVNNLKELVQECSNEVYRAEDVWNSKPRIAQATTYNI